jgi:ADP-ribosylglycohydrolase
LISKEDLQLLRDELTQRIEEGHSPGSIADKISHLEKRRKETSRDELEEIWLGLERLPHRTEFRHVEPSTLEEIRKARPRQLPSTRIHLSPDQLRDKILGAWLGRCVGCMLGRPVEGWKSGRIERYLRLAGSYPLTNYFPKLAEEPRDLKIQPRDERALLGNISGMIRDDDLDYTILNLHIFETYGSSFKTGKVAEEWLTHLPYLQVYTAERVAMRNLINGVSPFRSGSFRNPYREWIGARIRADLWGYIAPGNPEIASEYAFRDAYLSHRKNGIYAEMLVAAMISWAFESSDIKEVLEVGSSSIPANSRLARAISRVKSWYETHQDWQNTLQKIEDQYGSYHWIHAINNTAILVLSLLHGDGDFERTICAAVMGGLDTDCNGATAGSILGAVLGARALPSKWIRPLGEAIETGLSGLQQENISRLAERTFRQACFRVETN